jgi:hypothetical protein
MTRWSDGETRDKNETARLKYRQEVLAKAVESFQEEEIRRLTFLNQWMRATLEQSALKKVAAA